MASAAVSNLVVSLGVMQVSIPPTDLGLDLLAFNLKLMASPMV